MTPLEYDRTHIWHPYASLGNPPPVRLARSASGVEIELADGTRLVDAVSSWWCVAHGYSHPAIVEAVRRQSERLSHVMFGGFTHEPAIELAEKLAGFAPPGLDRVFFADSGSISVEVAAKMAVQYQAALGRPGRNRLVALKGGYHGDTSLCMALSDPDGMHTLFKGLMSPHFFAEKPTVAIDAAWDAEDVASLRKIVEEHADEIAALVCEPCFQAANAMNFYHPAYLKAMREICDAHGLLLIFDEIAAGCYRTGPRWAHTRAGIVPDVMTVGKALTGGHLTLAATLTTARVADVISNGRPAAFMHGPTYMANPLACAAGLAVLNVLQRDHLPEKAAESGAYFLGKLHELTERYSDLCAEARGLGLMIGLEFNEEKYAGAVIAEMSKQRIIAVYTLNQPKVIRFEPPLFISREDLDRVLNALEESLEKTRELFSDK